MTCEEHRVLWHSELNPTKTSETMRDKLIANLSNHVTPNIEHIYMNELTYLQFGELFDETASKKKQVVTGVEHKTPEKAWRSPSEPEAYFEMVDLLEEYRSPLNDVPVDNV